MIKEELVFSKLRAKKSKVLSKLLKVRELQDKFEESAFFNGNTFQLFMSFVNICIGSLMLCILFGVTFKENPVEFIMIFYMYLTGYVVTSTTFFDGDYSLIQTLISVYEKFMEKKRDKLDKKINRNLLKAVEHFDDGNLLLNLSDDVEFQLKIIKFSKRYKDLLQSILDFQSLNYKEKSLNLNDEHAKLLEYFISNLTEDLNFYIDNKFSSSVIKTLALQPKIALIQQLYQKIISENLTESQVKELLNESETSAISILNSLTDIKEESVKLLTIDAELKAKEDEEAKLLECKSIIQTLNRI